MVIIIDTNIIYGTWTFRSPEAKAFLDFIQKTNTTLFVPQIVWLEIKKNYKEALLKKAKDYKDSCQHFSSVLLEKPDFLHINFEVDEEVERYMNWLDDLLHLEKGKNIIAYSNDVISRVTERALYQRRPFNKDNQREFKDSLVWESVIDIMNSKGLKESEVAFISNDTNAFAANSKDSSIHSELKAEIDLILPHSFANTFYYYTTLESFLSTHNTPIAAINLESISVYLEHEESGFISLYSSVFNNSLDMMSELIKGSQTNAYFPSLEEDLSKAKYVSTAKGGSFFVYPFERTGEFTVFCKKVVVSSVTVSYAPATRPGFVESIPREINAEVSLTIAYKNNEFGRIGIESISLLEMEAVPFEDKVSNAQNRPRFIVSSKALLAAMDSLKMDYPNHNLRIAEILDSFLFKEKDERMQFTLDDTLEPKFFSLKKKTTNYTRPKKKRKKKGRYN